MTGGSDDSDTMMLRFRDKIGGPDPASDGQTYCARPRNSAECLASRVVGGWTVPSGAKARVTRAVIRSRCPREDRSA